MAVWRFAIAALALLSIGAPFRVAAAARVDQNVLRVIGDDLTELDPTQGSNRISIVYSQMVFDTLFALDGKMMPQPMMVDSYSVSHDGLTRKYVLRKGLKFHDGTPVTSKDAVASLRRWMDNTSIGGQLKARLASLTTDDDSNFTLVLKEPFGFVEFLLAGAGSPIPSIMREQDALRPYHTPMPIPVVGSGPFRYVDSERVVGSQSVFERNPGYVARSEPSDGLAGSRVVKVDRVKWMVMPDATTAAGALAANEADFWMEANPDQLPFLRERGLKFIPNGLPFVSFLRPNFLLPPFNDVRARQALALLVDQNELLPALAPGNGSSCHSFGVCGTFFGSENGSEPYRHPNIDKAKKLLAELGDKMRPIVMLSLATGRDNDIAQVLKQRLEQAGVIVDLQQMDLPTLLQRVRTKGNLPKGGGYNLFVYNATGSLWFHPLTNSALDLSCGGKNWPGFPCDEKSEALRERFLRANEAASQSAAFEDFETYLWTFMPYVPLGQLDVMNAYRPNIDGVMRGYVQPFWNITKH